MRVLDLRREHLLRRAGYKNIAKGLRRLDELLAEGGKKRSPQQLAKSRRGYLAQVKMLTVDERTEEAAKINKACQP
jgi:hypothetical protein